MPGRPGRDMMKGNKRLLAEEGDVIGKIGIGELLIVLVLALLVVGPDKLPELARSLGKAVRGLKQTLQETTEDLDGLEELHELREEVEGLQRELQSLGRETEKAVREPAERKDAVQPPEAETPAESGENAQQEE